MAVTPVPADNYEVVTGGTPVTLFGPNVDGGLMVNPSNADDQDISGTIEDVFVDPTGAAATLQGNGSCFRIPPGGYWNAIPGQTSSTSMNAQTSGHKTSAIKW
jgi:hypothetical protein